MAHHDRNILRILLRIRRGFLHVSRRASRKIVLNRTLALACVAFSALPYCARAQVSARSGTLDLTLAAFRQRVLAENETVQIRLLEFEVNRRKALTERGIFEPELYGSYLRESNRRQNTVQQQEQQLGATTFEELNNIYQGGLEALVPTGARVRLGYTLSDLRNSLQNNPSFFSRGATNGEYQSFLGVSLTQPLLKNAWYTATLAGIRLAALSSEIAFQDYRRQLMLVLSTAEATYWNLFMAQEQVRFFRQSVSVAERILTDARARLDVGKASELEVLESQSGLALRRTKLSQAEQSLQEAMTRLLTFFSQSTVEAAGRLHATDEPRLQSLNNSFFDLWSAALDLNPDYLIQRQKLMQEMVRLGYARNQRLPELNLKGSAGWNGLADTPGGSWDELKTGDFPSWSVGIEFRVPIGGGIRSANELAAARLKYKQALLALHDAEVQVANGIETAVQKLKNASDTAQNYTAVIAFNENLLKSALGRMEVGLLEVRKVLDIEADLFEARNSHLEARISYQRALLEIEFMQGGLLKNRELDLTKRELETKTAELITQRKLNGAGYETFKQELQQAYEQNKSRPPVPYTPVQKRALEAIHQYDGYWWVTNTPAVRTNWESQDRSLKQLRETIEQLNRSDQHNR